MASYNDKDKRSKQAEPAERVIVDPNVGRLAKAKTDNETLRREIELRKDTEKELLETISKQKAALAHADDAAASHAETSVALGANERASVKELIDFMFSLYRESESSIVRQKIKHWRQLLSKLV